MHELLNPNPKDFRQLFEQDFAGMPDGEVEYIELVTMRDRLVETIRSTLTESEKKFLRSIKQGRPAWEIFPVAGIEQLPAIQWKLTNIRKMNPDKKKESLRKLQTALGL